MPAMASLPQLQVMQAGDCQACMQMQHCLQSQPCCAGHLQSVLAAARTPAPGLSAGLLVNSTVFLLGLQVLLRGERVR